MPSSRFSSRPPARKRPAVCRKGPAPSPPLLRPFLPLALTAYVNYWDHDPVAFWDETAIFPIRFQPTPVFYLGGSARTGNRLDIIFTQEADPDFWNCELRIYSPFVSAELWKYPNLFVDQTLPFDTGKFGDVVIPGRDFRQLQIME